MLAFVATDHFDLQELHGDARRGLVPVAASSRHGIDRVDDDGVSDAQIVLGKITGCQISLWPNTSRPAFRIACSIVSMRR